MKILIVATSANKMTPSNDPTGIWLEELTTPVYAFRDAGCEVTISSIMGGKIPVDGHSLKSSGHNEASVERYMRDTAFQIEVAETPKFSDIDPASYDALFLPGGHGTMYDYPTNEGLARLVEQFDRDEKIVAAVCHGPAGLVLAKKADGTPFVAGRRMAGFTDSEERLAGLEKAVPFLLESRLRGLGAQYESGPDNLPFALRDGHLITGQNPASATKVAELMLEAFKAETAPNFMPEKTANRM